MNDIRAELERHNRAALAAFEKRLDAEGATEEQKAEALAFLREKLNQNAGRWQGGNGTKH